MPLARHPVLEPRDVVVVEAEAPSHGLAVGEVEHLRRGQALVGQLEQPRDDAQDRVRLPQRAVGEAHAQLASRPPRSTSPAPNVAWISGANVSMSGHITITSRGSSVGSSASRCRIASRSDLDLARAAVARVDLDAVVARAPGSGARSCADGGLDAGEQRALRHSPRVLLVARARPAEHELELARVLPPRGEQRGWRRGQVVLAPDDRQLALEPRPTAPARGAGRRGGRRGARAERARAPQGGRLGAASARTARTARAARPRPGSARSRAQAALEALGRTRGSPIRARSLRHSSACQAASSGAAVLARRPRADHLRPVQRVAVEQAGEVAQAGEAPAGLTGPSRCSASVRSQRLVEGRVDDRQQRPDRPARAARGPRPGRSRTPPRPLR